MASARSGTRPGEGITGVTAKTRSVIEGFTARLGHEGNGGERRHIPVDPAPITGNDSTADIGTYETEEDLEKQLKECFDRLGYKPRKDSGDAAMQRLDDWREPVTDGVVERILAQWAGSEGYASLAAEIRNQVIERLMERVLEHLPKKSKAQ